MITHKIKKRYIQIQTQIIVSQPILREKPKIKKWHSCQTNPLVISDSHECAWYEHTIIIKSY